MTADDQPDGPIVPRFLSSKPAATPTGGAKQNEPSVEAGADDLPTVRPFVVTKGRTKAHSKFAPETQLMAVADPAQFSFELRALLEMIEFPLSVAEVSAKMKLPLQAVGVLASDLNEAGAIQVNTAGSVDDPQMIRRLIDVVRAI